MEIRIANHNIQVLDAGAQNEIVSIPLSGYDVIELFYLREILNTLLTGNVSSESRIEIDDAVVQVEDVLADRLTSPSLGLSGNCFDIVV